MKALLARIQKTRSAATAARRSPEWRSPRLVRDTLYRAKEYEQKRQQAAERSAEPPARDPQLESLLPVIRREIPLKAHCHRADDIMTALRIRKELDIEMTLDHCTEGYLIADEIAASGCPVILGPIGNLPAKAGGDAAAAIPRQDSCAEPAYRSQS